MFNAQEYLEALDRPTYTDTRGRTHVGEVVSTEEWLPIQERLFETVQDGVDMPTMRILVREITKLMFPVPWYQRLNPFYRSVTRDVLALPPMGMLSAVWSFLQSQGRQVGVEMPETPPGMTTSPNPDVKKP